MYTYVFLSRNASRGPSVVERRQRHVGYTLQLTATTALKSSDSDNSHDSMTTKHTGSVNLCEISHVENKNKKHLKNVGPIRYCEPPLHCYSPGVASAGGVRCPQRQRVTEWTAMAPWNGPKKR